MVRDGLQIARRSSAWARLLNVITAEREAGKEDLLRKNRSSLYEQYNLVDSVVNVPRNGLKCARLLFGDCPDD